MGIFGTTYSQTTDPPSSFTVVSDKNVSMRITEIKSDYPIGNVLVPALKLAGNNEVNFVSITKSDSVDYFRLTFSPPSVVSQTTMILRLCHYDGGDSVQSCLKLNDITVTIEPARPSECSDSLSLPTSSPPPTKVTLYREYFV